VCVCIYIYIYIYANTVYLKVNIEPLCCPFMMDQGSEMFGFLAGYFKSCVMGTATSVIGWSILRGDVVTRS